MIHKQIIYTLTLLAISGTGIALAQNADQDPKAKQILDEVSAKTKSYTSLKLTFKYSMDNAQDDLHEEQQGSLLLKGSQYKLTMLGREIYSDGKTRWTYLSEDDEVQIGDPDEDGSLSPTTILTIYEQGFKYKYVGEETKGGKTMQLIHLYPEDAGAKPYHTVKLYVDKTKKQIHAITTLGKEGDNYTYEILTLTPNPATTNADFVFNVSAHPDVEVIDLRD